MNDEQKHQVAEMSQTNLSQAQIGELVGVHQSTVSRYIQSFDEKNQLLKKFKTHRADFYSDFQRQSLEIQIRVLEKLREQDFSALSPEAKTRMLRDLEVSKGISFDKERLERGESTANVSTWTHLIKHIHTAKTDTPLPDEPRPQDSEESP